MKTINIETMDVSMKTSKNYGLIACCRYCGQDIQFFGFTKWLDRGANRSCVPFIKSGEVIKPKTKHSPHKG